MNYEEWLGRAVQALDTHIQDGRKFEIKHLFPGHEWEALSRGERIGFGIYFSNAVKDGQIDGVVRCEEGKNHHNQYRKVR